MSVDLREITVAFEGRKVLNRVSASFPAGKIACVMGPSGVGKSTLLALIAGYVQPSEGKIDTHGIQRHQIAFIVQSTPLLPKRSVRENVALGGLSRGKKWSQSLEEADALLESLAMYPLANDRGYTLSGGERQRIVILRAIAQGAPIILADEPTASLDPKNRAAIFQTLRLAADDGAAVVVATHDAYVANLADSLVRL